MDIKRNFFRHIANEAEVHVHCGFFIINDRAGQNIRYDLT